MSKPKLVKVGVEVEAIPSLPNTPTPPTSVVPPVEVAAPTDNKVVVINGVSLVLKRGQVAVLIAGSASLLDLTTKKWFYEQVPTVSDETPWVKGQIAAGKLQLLAENR